MLLTFKGGNEYVKLDIDRENKKFLAASSTSNLQMVEKPYSELFDNEEEMKQMENAPDGKFYYKIIITMARAGYKFIGKR